MRQIRTQGIILKRKNYGEADRIVTVLTENLGKIQVKAAGVRKIISRRSSHIELLNLSQLTLYKGRGMPVVTEAQTIESFEVIKSDLSTIGIAYYLCELADGLCAEEQENRIAFHLLNNTLHKLTLVADVRNLVREFELSILSHLGFTTSYQTAQNVNTTALIEQILEKKIKTRQIFPYFA